jgi:hypothetical protein
MWTAWESEKIKPILNLKSLKNEGILRVFITPLHNSTPAPVVYRIRMFNPADRKFRHWSRSWASIIHSIA